MRLPNRFESELRLQRHFDKEHQEVVKRIEPDKVQLYNSIARNVKDILSTIRVNALKGQQ